MLFFFFAFPYQYNALFRIQTEISYGRMNEHVKTNKNNSYLTVGVSHVKACTCWDRPMINSNYKKNN